MITDQSRCNGVTSINKIGIKMAYGIFKPKAIWLTWPNIPGHKDKEGENNLIKESRKIIPPPLEMLDERRSKPVRTISRVGECCLKAFEFEIQNATTGNKRGCKAGDQRDRKSTR